MRLFWLLLAASNLLLTSYCAADPLCASPRMRPCLNGRCIAEDYFCNQENDCGDWSDELDCKVQFTVNGVTLECPANSLYCETKHINSCIKIHSVCDGKKDCPDGDDELHCTIKNVRGSMKCSRNMFTCANKGRAASCIPYDLVCDGRKDCPGGDDELNCTLSNELCHSEYPCYDKLPGCIDKRWICNGVDDCADGRDEICTENEECKNGLKCGNECILSKHVCDGIKDCFDGSDEINCSPKKESCSDKEGWLTCKSNDTLRCLHVSQVCDGQSDCDDTSDESSCVVSMKDSTIAERLVDTCEPCSCGYESDIVTVRNTAVQECSCSNLDEEYATDERPASSYRSYPTDVNPTPDTSVGEIGYYVINMKRLLSLSRSNNAVNGAQTIATSYLKILLCCLIAQLLKRI